MKKFLVFLCAVLLVLGVVGSVSATSIANPDFLTGFPNWHDEGDVIRLNKNNTDPSFPVDRAKFGGVVSAPTAVVGTWQTYGYTAWLSQCIEISPPFADPLAGLSFQFEYKFVNRDDDSFHFAFALKDKTTKAITETWKFDLASTSGFSTYEAFVDLTTATLTNQKGVVAFFLDEAKGVTSESGDTFAILNATIPISVTDVPTPEPATMLLLGSGLIGMAALGRWRYFKK